MSGVGKSWAKREGKPIGRDEALTRSNVEALHVGIERSDVCVTVSELPPVPVPEMVVQSCRTLSIPRFPKDDGCPVRETVKDACFALPTTGGSDHG